MAQTYGQRPLADETDEPLRITMILSTKQMDLKNVVPLCKTLLNRATVNQRDLAAMFPNDSQFKNPQALATSLLVAAAVACIIFPPLHTPVLWFLIPMAAVALLRTLYIVFETLDVTVRGDLPDIVAEADTLASWLAGGRSRKARIEVWGKVHVEAVACTPEEVGPMLERVAKGAGATG